MGFNRGQWILLATIALLFAAGTSVLSWDNARVKDLAPRFHWPDETTNYFFASQVANGEPMVVSELRNAAVGNRIHPRTANVRPDGALVPGAYLGLPLWYGLLGRVLGVRGMLFVTPMLAASALLAFAVIVCALVGARSAMLATIILALAPPWWLFTATAMLPNVPFVALLLVGIAILCQRIHWAKCVLAGLVIGLALTIRTHEVLWVLVLLAVIVWQRRATGSQCFAFVVGIALPFVPILVSQNAIFGSPFTTGYALLQNGGALPTEFASQGTGAWRWLWALVAPFGWEPLLALARFWNYIVVPYWWLVAAAVMGMTSAVAARRTRAVIVTLAFMGWLVLLYGSWTIADPLVRATNILTISYARYWLPMVIMLAGWAAVGVHALVTRTHPRLRAAMTIVVMLGMVMSALPQTIADTAEGLRTQRQELVAHRDRARAVVAATEPNAIVLSHRMDKVFFPERAVIHVPENLHDDPTLTTALTALIAHAPIYWYAASIPDLEGFRFVPMSGVPFNERLFRVEVRS